MSEKELSFDPLIYTEVFEISPQGICLISDRGIYLDVNQKFAELLGYSSKNDLIGKSIEEVTHPDDFEADRIMTEKIFSGSIDSFELDKRFLKKNGDVTWLKLHARTYQKKYGIGVLEPISERTKLETRIAKLKKDLDQFTYRISHDIRSPVVNILGLTSMDCKTEEEFQYLMKQIKVSALKLDHIIREIADYAHNRKFPIREENVNLVELIEQICADALTEKTNEKSIDIKQDIRHNNGVKVDHSRLNIVLKNLVLNSLAFGKDQGSTVVSAEVVDSELILNIKDDGVGIRKDIQAKIYDMFYRGSNISEGAGLGLFIVKDILKEIDGEISFTSEEGTGTEFIVRIPLDRQ
ncbi:MAG: PAS domain-containing sensor histidine kinase [Ekhidna sp.]